MIRLSAIIILLKHVRCDISVVHLELSLEQRWNELSVKVVEGPNSKEWSADRIAAAHPASCVHLLV